MNLDDLLSDYRRLKAKRDQLDKDGKDIPSPRQGVGVDRAPQYGFRTVTVHSNDEYDQRLRYRNKMRALNSRRIIDMSHELAQLRGKIRAARQHGTPEAMFVNYDSQKTGYQKTYMNALGQMIDAADENLPYAAADAITGFVGHGYSKAPEEGMPGLWTFDRMEDAYSATPSDKGLEIRQELTAAFAPIKAALKKEFGEVITIHRAQRRLTGTEKPRRVLSWTSNLKFAQSLIDDGDTLMTKEIRIDDIIWITDRANQSEFIVRMPV